ncbi:MAG: hypothetical protein ACJ74Z_02655 [Bryobacteraceae bacterium]
MGLLLVSLVEDIVEPVSFLFFLLLCFDFFFVVVVVVPLVSFVLCALLSCANTAEQGNSESPRAAIMIFFILGNLLITY